MSTNNARSGGLGLFMLGLVFGATAAGVGVYVWKERELQRRGAEMRDALQMANLQSPAPGPGRLVMSGNAASLEFGNTTPKGLMATDSNPSPIRIEAILKKLGDDCMEDLRQDRVTSVYRLTTKAYQQKTTREQFEEMIHKVVKVRLINSGQPESKVRK